MTKEFEMALITKDLMDLHWMIKKFEEDGKECAFGLGDVLQQIEEMAEKTAVGGYQSKIEDLITENGDGE